MRQSILPHEHSPSTADQTRMAVPVASIAFTVQDAMIACGIDNVSLFEGAPQTERIASDIFDDNFTACMDKTYEDLDDDLKGYSVLTQAQGQI